ncbi:unnamed protein product, partial [Polarella glacialis]
MAWRFSFLGVVTWSLIGTPSCSEAESCVPCGQVEWLQKGTTKNCCQATCYKGSHPSDRGNTLDCSTIALGIAEVAPEEKDCMLNPEDWRETTRIQSTTFSRAYLLNLTTGLNCISKIKTPWGAANQSLHAYADFYEQFYAFRKISRDPEASVQSQVPPFSIPLYGSSDGGGASPKESDVDLIGGLRKMADILENQPSVLDWYMPMSSLFHRLRDAHVSFDNGGTKVDDCLNQFIFMLQDESLKEAVSLEVRASGSIGPEGVKVDGPGQPRMVAGGRVVKSIAGMEPVRWLEKNVVRNPAFNYPYKSLGARLNHLLKLAHMGLAWLGSSMGDLSSLEPNAKVIFEDGSSAVWSWKWLMLTKNFPLCQALPNSYDGACCMKTLTDILYTPAALHMNAIEAWKRLHGIPAEPVSEESKLYN